MGTRSNTPVFCDQSGVRSRVLQWGGRSVALLVLLLCAGLALTLDTRVEVPGLSRLLSATEIGSELFDAPTRRDRPSRQLVGEGKVMVPETSEQTVARVRELPVPKPTSAAPTVEPAVVAQLQPTATTPGTTPSAAPSVQSLPTRVPSPTANPRNTNAADARENPNAHGSAADAPGHTQAKTKAKGNGANAPSPKTRVEPTIP